MKRRLVLSSVLASSFPVLAGSLTNKFVDVKLAYGLQISIPRTWEVLRGSEMAAIDTAVGAAIDLSGASRVLSGSESLLAANFPDADLYASVSVTAIGVKSVTPSSASQFTNADIISMQGVMRQGIERSQAAMGTKIWSWSDLIVEQLGSYKIMRTSYFRSSVLGDTRVQLYKFFGAGRVFDIALSTRASAQAINQSILDRIIQSVRIPS